MTVNHIPTPKLTIALMTRGRPQIARKTVETMLPLIRRKNTSLVVLIDDDDAKTVHEFRDFASHPHLLVSIKPREDSRGEKYDRVLKMPADVYLPMCDYAPIITDGFDELILEAADKFPDGLGCVYTEMANMSFPHYQAPTAKLVAKMGYIYPPYFPFWFIDHWLDDLCRMIDRIAYADIKCDPSMFTGKTIGLRDLEFWTWLYDAGRNHRREQAMGIIKDLREPAWRKDVLASNFPLHEHRSVCINHSVRMSKDQIERDRGGLESQVDERYRRIKAKADILFKQWAQSFEGEVKDRKAKLLSDIVQAAWDHDKDKVTTLVTEWTKVAA